MFVEYLNILGKTGEGDVLSRAAIVGKLGLIIGVYLVLIYLAYKVLGKFGALAVFIVEVIIFAIANDLVPFNSFLRFSIMFK